MIFDHSARWTSDREDSEESVELTNPEATYEYCGIIVRESGKADRS